MNAAIKTAFAGLTGAWRSRGYGLLLEVRPEGYTVYEETAVSRLPVYRGTLEELASHYADLEVSPGAQSFSVRRAASATRVGFRRLKTLPPAHPEFNAPERFDPELNFEVLWHTFAEHYAFFELKGVDWEATYRAQRRRVGPDTSAEELFDVFVDMLRPLHDGHVELHTSCGHFDASAVTALHDRLAAELDRADDARDVASYLADLREWLRDTIHEHYLHDGLRHAGNRYLEWGRLNEETGYLNIRAMAGLCGRVGRPREDVAAVDAAMVQVLDELGELERLAIDLRFNGGGYDTVALQLAGYLIDRKRHAFSKAARHGAGTTGKQAVAVEARGELRYGGELVVLTSELTASAAEVFVLAFLQHPRLTLVGEPTHGILSDAMERHLPNGWLVTLSNERYYAADGELYEHCGVPPHVELPFLDQDSREAGRDPMLDYVLE